MSGRPSSRHYLYVTERKTGQRRRATCAAGAEPRAGPPVLRGRNEHGEHPPFDQPEHRDNRPEFSPSGSPQFFTNVAFPLRAVFHINAHYDERCFLPIHVYDTATSRPVAVLLRTGTTPSGVEIRGHLRRMVRRIRSHWRDTRLTIRGDSHYGRPEVMAWCEANGIDYIFGLAGNAAVDRLVEPVADEVRVRRAQTQAPVIRRYCETRYGARSWRCERRVAARIEATTQGLDIRYVVTNITGGSAQWLYDSLYCPRGQAENLINPNYG